MNVVLKRYGWFLLKVLIFGLTLFYLNSAISKTGRKFNSFESLLPDQGNFNSKLFISFSAILILFNWGLEAAKWQLLASRIARISFWKAFRSVMVGLTLGFITPNRIGDYAGRILDLNSPKRFEAFGAVFLGRFAQLIITLLAGSAGCFYISGRFYLTKYFWIQAGVGLLLLSLNVIAFLFYFNGRLILSFVLIIRPLRRFLVYIRVLARYSVSELTRVLLMAALRYAVFCLQFALLLAAFGIKLPAPAYLSGITGTFLLKSIVPSLSALTDIGMREISAMHFFQLFGQDPVPVISASLGLWFINIVLPSAFGLLFIFQLKLRKGKNL